MPGAHRWRCRCKQVLLASLVRPSAPLTNSVGDRPRYLPDVLVGLHGLCDGGPADQRRPLGGGGLGLAGVAVHLAGWKGETERRRTRHPARRGQRGAGQA